MVGEDLISIISQVGFPIAIAIYLLITRDKTIQANTDALNNLSKVVETLLYKEK